MPAIIHNFLLSLRLALVVVLKTRILFVPFTHFVAHVEDLNAIIIINPLTKHYMSVHGSAIDEKYKKIRIMMVCSLLYLPIAIK